MGRIVLYILATVGAVALTMLGQVLYGFWRNPLGLPNHDINNTEDTQ